MRPRTLWTGLPLLGVLALAQAACDIQKATDAFDEVGLVIELPPINTVVTARILDAATGRPVTGSVELEFGGPAGNQIIDVYSDPLTRATVNSGFFSFGLSNAVVPTEASPATFTVRASASGYQPRTETVSVIDKGNDAFSVRLVPDDPTRPMAGTAGTRTLVGTVAGATPGARTLQTAATSEEGTSATLEIPAGTRALKADGTALTGDWTVDLRYYDTSPAALDALPPGALTSESGQFLLVVGTLDMQIRDARTGEVATRLVTSGGSPAPGPEAAGPACSGTRTTFKLGPQALARLELLRQTTVEVFGRFGTSSVPRRMGTAPVVDGTAHVCSADLDFSPGGGQPLLSLTVVVDVPRRSLDATVVLRRETPGAAAMVRVVWGGPGTGTIDRDAVSLAGSTSTTVRMHTLQIPEIAGYRVWARDRAGVLLSDTVPFNPFGGSATVTLRAPAPGAIDVTLELVAKCPAGQKVGLTGSLDGLTINYQRAGGQLVNMPRSDMTIETTKTAFVKGQGIMRSVRPNTTYTFYATLGSETQTQNITTPASAGTVSVDATKLNEQCR